MVGLTTVGNLLLIYLAYVIAIGIAHKFEISFPEALKKSVTLPLTPFKPLTPLQKEIRDEERIIKELKRQRVDMERLAVLKLERDALFEEVGDKHVERAEDHSDERVRVTVDGCQIPHIFSSKELANDYVEHFHPKAKEIEMRGRFTL